MENVNQSILIVDDVAENVGILINLLENEQYRISYAFDGNEALKKIDVIHPDLILLDIMMPEPNGFELCRILKSSDKTKEIPVIFITAKNHPEDIVEGFNLGAVDYVTKPFIKRELIARINNHLLLNHAKELLKKSNERLEQQVKERTQHLEEANSAMKFILKQRDEYKEELKDNVLANAKELIYPCLENIKKCDLNEELSTYISQIEKYINEIISPFITKISAPILKLTPTEIRVANYIKEGKSNKEMAELLNLSENTLTYHRYHIRKKIGLNNKKINLRTFLQSLES